MARRRPSARILVGRLALKVFLYALIPLLIAPSLVPLCAQQAASSRTDSSSGSQTSSESSFRVLPRGKKLLLKDGSYQLVREYKIEGDRVRYYSLDSSSWEAMPVDLVDWDATKKAEADEARQDAALAAKAGAQEAARVIPPLDIDASLEVAPGVFLPAGVNLFAFDGKSILPLSQAETSSKISKGRVLEEVMVPIPIVPSRQNVSIQGARAKFRMHVSQPEFYIRTADAREPRLELIRAKAHGDSRLIEHIDQLFGEKQEIRDALPMQKWEVARGVYRFTLDKPLEPGEYALAEVLDEEGMSLYVWDFGVDAGAASGTKPTKAAN